jgi:hypothetical protein
VVHVDHAPVNNIPPPLRLCSQLPDSQYICAIKLPLTSMDMDDESSDDNVTTSSLPYYRITKWPLLGAVYQIPSILDVGTEPLVMQIPIWILEALTTDATVTFAWATQVVAVSSQYSNCGSDCYHMETCGSSTPCTDTSFHASNILGAYDWYPKYSSGILTWNPSSTLSLEYIELDFGQLMYVTSIEIYETWITGSVIKLSVASDWYGSEYTSWTTLWQSATGEAAIPLSSARVFAPSLCACLTSIRYLRVDIDTRYGRPSIDAIKMIGSSKVGVGQLMRGGLFYVPPEGIEVSELDTSSTTVNSSYIIMDTFGYQTSDCLVEANDATIVTVYPQLTPVTFYWQTYYLSLLPAEDTLYELPLESIRDCEYLLISPPQIIASSSWPFS